MEGYPSFQFEIEHTYDIATSVFLLGVLGILQLAKRRNAGEVWSSYLHGIRNDLLVQFSAFLDQMLPQTLAGKTHSEILGSLGFWGRFCEQLQSGRENMKILKYPMVLVG